MKHTWAELDVQHKKRLEDAFKEFDRDKNAKLSLAECEAVILALLKAEEEVLPASLCAVLVDQLQPIVEQKLVREDMDADRRKLIAESLSVSGLLEFRTQML